LACAESRIFELLCTARNREKQKKERKVIREERGLFIRWLVKIIVAPVLPCIEVFLTCYITLSCKAGLELK